MNKKIKSLIFVVFSLVILLSAKSVFANPITPLEIESYFSITRDIGTNELDLFGLAITISIIVLGLGSEIFFGYLFFFRHNKKGILSLVYANLISYPIFYSLTSAIHFLSIIQGEAYVIIIEAIFIRLYLNEEISFKKSVFISILLNVLSIVFSVVLFLIIMLIINIIYSNLYPNNF